MRIISMAGDMQMDEERSAPRISSQVEYKSVCKDGFISGTDLQGVAALRARLAAAPDREAAVSAVLSGFLELLSCGRGILYVHAPESSTLELVSSVGIPEHDLAKLGTASTRQALCRVILQHSRPLFSEPASQNEFTRALPDLDSAPVRASHVLAVQNPRGEVLGALVAFFPRPRNLTQREGMLLDLYSQTAAELFARVTFAEQARAAAPERDGLLQRVAAAVYTCDAEGYITSFNEGAVEVWGRRPRVGHDRWSGAMKLYRSDGSPLPPEESPMALALRTGQPVRGQEIIVERSDGTRAWISPRPEPIFDAAGKLVGAVNTMFDITPLKEREQELAVRNAELQAAADRHRAAQGARHHLAAIVESSEDAIISKNLQGIITSWNRGAERLFGYRAEETIGRSITMLMPPERVNEEPAILTRISRGQPVEHYETIRRRKDGTLIHISLTVSPVRDEEGRIIGASKIARDITQRKKEESDLQRRTRVLEIINRTSSNLNAHLEVEPLMQAVTDAATEASGAKFGAFFYTSVKPDGEKFLLYTLSGAPREAFEKLGHPRSTEVFSPTFRGEGIVRSGDITADPRYGKMAPYYGMPPGHLPVRSYLAVPVTSRSGEVLGGLFFAHPERDVFDEESEGVVSGIAGQAAVALDNARLYHQLRNELALQEKAQAALRQSESQFRSLAESLPQIVWSARPDGYVDYYNSRWYEFTGFEESFGDPSWLPILHQADVQRTSERWRHSVATGEPFEIENRFIDYKTGSYRWYLGRALPVRNERGEIVKWLGTCTDIDDQKRAAERLEHAVSERTLSLQQAVKQMEEFSYSVSHDLRAPLRAIDGYARVITEDFGARLEPGVKELLSKISRNAARMQQLINDVLILSRVARLEVKLGPVSLRDILLDIIEQNPQLQSPRARVELGALGHVLAQDVLLSQALTNLLNNAVKFVRPGITPIVKIWSGDAAGKTRLWVEDNGIGIRPEHQGKLFGMFQRLNQAPSYEGTGIGLAIVRKAIERMGGTVGVESNGIDGSKFWIELKTANVQH